MQKRIYVERGGSRADGMAGSGAKRHVPFVVGVPVSGEHFVGRKDILRRIAILVAGAQNGAINHMMLPGLRRVGKSSLLLCVRDRLAREPGVVPVIVNAAGVPTRQRFAELYMQAVSRAYADKTGDRDLPRRIRRAVEDALKGPGGGAEGAEASVAESVRFAIKFSEPSTDEGELVEHALDYPEVLGAGSGLLFVVMIDEFQDLLAWGAPFQSAMRRIIQAQKSATYIFAGSAPSAMRDIAHHPSAPFYRQLHDMHVEPLSEDEVLEFARDRFGSAGIEVEPDAAGHMYVQSCGFPDYVQRMSLISFMHCVEEGGRAVSLPDIERAYSEMLAQIGPEFEAQFGGLSRGEREVLIALARSRDGIASISRAVRAPSTSIPRTLGRLISKDLVKKHLEHRYAITDPVFSDWIVQRYGDGLDLAPPD